MEHTKDGQRKTVPTTNYVAYSKHSTGRGIYVIAYIHMFLLHNVEAVYDSGSLPRHLDLGPRSVCFGWMGPVAVRASRTDVINLGVPARYRSIMMTNAHRHPAAAVISACLGERIASAIRRRRVLPSA